MIFKYFLSIALLIISIGTFAQDRIALVIGNANYDIKPLKNPINDARDIANSIKDLGFKVTFIKDANKSDIELAIRNFELQIKNGGTSLFFYSGHAVQINNINYLLPVGSIPAISENFNTISNDANIKRIQEEAISSKKLIDLMANSNSEVNLIFLDACRNNPISGDLKNGLVKSYIHKEGALKNFLISYSTYPGGLAQDHTNLFSKNSPYTESILKFINTPNQLIELMLKDVGLDVFKETKEKQIPWYEVGQIGKFCFNELDKNCGKGFSVSGVKIKTEDGRYLGGMAGDLFHGKGVYIWNDGRRYEGDFINGLRHGNGIFLWPNGSRYEGKFVNQLQHGHGLYTHSNGSRYEGEFRNGKRYIGLLTLTDGSRYEGEFQNNLRHGYGVYTSSNGYQYKGDWLKGLEHGEIIVTTPDGIKISMIWKKGILVSHKILSKD